MYNQVTFLHCNTWRTIKVERIVVIFAATTNWHLSIYVCIPLTSSRSCIFLIIFAQLEWCNYFWNSIKKKMFLLCFLGLLASISLPMISIVEYFISSANIISARWWRNLTYSGNVAIVIKIFMLPMFAGSIKFIIYWWKFNISFCGP